MFFVYVAQINITRGKHGYFSNQKVTIFVTIKKPRLSIHWPYFNSMVTMVTNNYNIYKHIKYTYLCILFAYIVFNKNFL